LARSWRSSGFLLNPVWNIVNSFSELQRSLAAMERVFEILAMPSDKPDGPDAVTRRGLWETSFEDVEFEYRGASGRQQFR
jgi:ATP-binding cassette subfamily B protein/subfamily B ATP-binding cassette protein MsbA